MNDIRKNDIVLALLFVTETSQEYKKQPSEVFYLKKAFLKISQISQENTFLGVSFY